jgi:hypothetical protein
VYVPRKDWQLVCQHVNSHQAGTVDSRVDHNEQGIKPETCQGYREKMVWKTTEDLERIRDPRSSVANANDGIPQQILDMCSPLRSVQLWRGYLRYLSLRDLVFSPCVRGGSRITFRNWTSTLPMTDSNVWFEWPWRIYSPTYSKALVLS